MANKIKEIKNFFSGILSSFSSSDIKDDNASFSLNVDSSDKDGVIKGVTKDNLVVDSSEIDSNVSRAIETENGKHDLIYSDSENGDIKVIKDLYGSKIVTSPLGASGVGGPAESMEVKNDKVYVGHGKSLKPKILYKTKNSPFKRPTEMSEWIYEDSSVYDRSLLNSSFTIDRFINLPAHLDTTYRSSIGIRYDHDNLYFIDWQGEFDTTLNLFDLSGTGDNNTKIHLGEDVVGIGENGKAALKGAACDLCQANVNQWANSIASGANDKDYYFWVLTVSHEQSEAESFATIEKFAIRQPFADSSPGASASAADIKGSIEPLESYTVNFEGNTNPPNGAVPGSILETKHHLWIQYWKPSGDKFTRQENFLFCIKLTEIPDTSAELTFQNKSLNYDKIKKGRAKLNMGEQYASRRLRETYFYNATRSWKSLKTGNWLRGKEEWDHGTSNRGNHKYSGIYCPDSTAGFVIQRHGLVISPLINKEDPKYLKQKLNYDESTDEDWVAVMSTCDDQVINIYSAWQYRVPGGINWHSYQRLRAGDCTGDGSEIEGAENDLQELFNVILNFFQFLGDGIMWFIGAVANNLGISNDFDVYALTLMFYGDEDVNWYYNGKCFEGGFLKAPLINISSNHNPEANLNLDDGARVHIRDLYGFDKNLEIICIKHYNDRLMISCHDPSVTDTETQQLNTVFLMYNTSENSVTETSPRTTFVIHPDDPNVGEDFAGNVAIPWEYLAAGSTLHPRANKIHQAYVPVSDLSVSSLGIYPNLMADVDGQLSAIYPHLYDGWYRNPDEVSVEVSNLLNIGDAGEVYVTEDATFDIYRAGDCYFDGRKDVNMFTGYSSYDGTGDHIAFLATAGPLNLSKFNFKLVSNNQNNTDINDLSSSGQLNMPENPWEVYPEDEVAIISLNQEPNATASNNLKQYALDTKALSFSVKAHNYVGSHIAPFIHNNDDGKELYRYKVNLVYDGYQDSPLSNHYTEVNISDLFVRGTGAWSAGQDYVVDDQVIHSGAAYTCIRDHTSSGSNNAQGSPTESSQTGWNDDDGYSASALAVTINLHKPDNFSRRITHLRLWKSICALTENQSSGDDVYTIDHAYNLVDTVPLGVNWGVSNEASTIYNQETANTSLGNVATVVVVDNGKIGASYEAYTGIKESMKILQPNYTISTQLNSYLYVGNCSHPSFEDASNLVFRSKPDRFNIFDWTRDFISIPSKPRAITSYNGRIIVWDSNNMYVINPSGLYIEDTFEGTGCLSSTSYERTEGGVCFADENNIYIYDGNNVKNIGIPIITSHKSGLKISWRDRDKEYPTHIKYESEKRCFCIFFKINGGQPINWLQRAAEASNYDGFRDLEPKPERWFDIPESHNSFINEGDSFKYIWHLGMWQEFWENNGNEGPPNGATGNFYEPFYYAPLDITLPYGTGYDIETQRYIVDLDRFFDNNISGVLNSFENTDSNLLYILQKSDIPDYTSIIHDGKLVGENKDSYYCYTYNTDKDRWDLISMSEYRGVFGGAKGELYVSSLTTEDYLLDPTTSAVTNGFNLAEDAPLGGTGGIVSELDLQWGQNTIESGNIVEMKTGTGGENDVDGYYQLEGSINQVKIYEYETGKEAPFATHYYGAVITQWGGHRIPEDGSAIGKAIICSPAPYTQGIQTTILAVNSHRTFIVYLGTVPQTGAVDADVWEYPYQDDFLYENIGDWFDQNMTGGIWRTPQIGDPNLPYGDGDSNAGNYLEVTTDTPHGLSAGDIVKITESGAMVTTGDPNHELGNKNGSPFKYGLDRTVSFINDEYTFRFMVPHQESYYQAEEWGTTAGSYLNNWWNEIKNWEYNNRITGNLHQWWPHHHHGTATWEKQEPWMLLPNVGDLNEDGVVNSEDRDLANSYTYIIVEGREFKDSLGYEVDGFNYYPDIIIVDETCNNNYHRLSVINVYAVEKSTDEWLSYVLVQTDSYPYNETDFGWNDTSYYNATNKIPAGSKVVINDEALVLPGEFGLSRLFDSEEVKQFTYISKNFSFDNHTVNKLISKIKVVYQNTPPKFEYMINNNGSWIAPIVSNIVYKDTSLSYKLPKEHKKVKSIKIKLISNTSSNPRSYDTEVDSFSIIYRERGNA